MMKKLLFMILAVAVCLCLSVTVLAAESPELVLDEAQLLTKQEARELEEALREIYEKYDMQVAVLTLEEMDFDIDDAIGEIYDEAGYETDGVLLLVCMNPRDFRILCNGEAAKAISKGNSEDICDSIKPDLSRGDYEEAFRIYGEQCAYYMDGYINGFPFKFGKNLLVALVIGILIGVIVAFSLKAQLKSVRPQKEAAVYVKPGSMQLTQSYDFYLYSHISKTPRPKSNSSSGGSRHVSGGSF